MFLLLPKIIQFEESMAFNVFFSNLNEKNTPTRLKFRITVESQCL